MELNDDPDSLLEDWGTFAAAMAAMSSSMSVGAVADQAPEFIATLKSYCPIKAAATFGALTTQKRLQGNALRLETLVHLCVACCQGERAPTQQLLVQGFTAIGSVCGELEDDPEDVFSSRIYSKRGNYQVLGGLWEGGAFYLQRFVNLADGLPDDPRFQSITNSIHALLRLSDAVCERANLRCNDLGANSPEEHLPSRFKEESAQLRKLVRFTKNDITQLGIRLPDLIPFVFDPDDRYQLRLQAVSHSDLEAKPLAFDDEYIYVLMPNAISATIRRYFILALGTGENRGIFLRALAREYSQMFECSPFLGKRGTRVPFAFTHSGTLCAMSQEVDVGRYLNVLFVLDDLDGFEEDGFGGLFDVKEGMQEQLKKAVASMQSDAAKRPGFKEGITLTVICGIGRGTAVDELVEPQVNWQQQIISAADLLTLSRSKSMEPLNLFRLCDMESVLMEKRVSIQNINGLLNLFAWTESLNGHLVPHAEIPDDWNSDEHQHFLTITQNALVDLRHQVSNSVDEQVQQFVDGAWMYLIKESASYFEEDNERPTYVHLSAKDRSRLIGSRITLNRCWWYEVVAPVGQHSARTLENWKMLGTWMARAADALERAFASQLGSGAILWRCEFPSLPLDGINGSRGSEADLEGAFAISVARASRTINVKVGSGFYRALYHPHNIAERALVRAFVAGAAELTSVHYHDSKIEEVVREIVPNQDARYSHVFAGRGFRDYFHSEISENPITINRFDDAVLRLGLGWTARSPKDGGLVSGKQECLDFLHSLVGKLQKEVGERLRRFDKAELIKQLILNYEVASLSRDRWHRTAAAVLALRDDKDATIKAMSEYEFKLNGTLQPTRNLVEVALCEAGTDAQLQPGVRDIGLLLAMSAQIFHLGGWADLIHWDLLEPELRIRALGDVHANHDFMDTVMDGFGQATSEHRFKSSARKYEKYLKHPDAVDDSSTIEGMREFLSAWESDFGAHLDEFRRFIDKLENYGVEQNEPVFFLRRSDLVALADTPVGSLIIDALTLVPRPQWNELPSGYSFKDIAPWKFRRRLSVLRRPLLQISDESDPVFVIAPGLVRDGFLSTVGNFYDGAYPDIHLGPAMRRYAGYARNRDGKTFNNRVSSRMKDFGWTVLPEAFVTKILGKAFDRNYGDVDVLAWSHEVNRVLIMECKDLQFRKTYGEIAEQLSDYRGEASADGKTRDSLRKHLDRVEIIRTNRKSLCSFLSIKEDVAIESHLVFSHPVPMMYSGGPVRDLTETRSYDQLSELKVK
ncbi:zinc chelation protein SecC [Rugamonas rivuli]|uniref:Zinc chelation protein SecC n=1 Tax=Rugamonas rivuli TaxID=2743358 RepID=A0A843SAU2_9BURK|nr:zinc chelation protein SecC [Rugamonas rivuli]MQA19333.1 zinc chelation protein SecC [Rugamonas rivuli]